jgi:hypothetical protein
MVILADGGLTQSLLARGGRVATDRRRFSDVVRTALGLRRRLELVTLAVGVPLLILLLRAHGVDWAGCIGASLAVAAAMHGNVTQTVYSTVAFLQLRPIGAQRAAVVAGAVRLLLTVAAFLLLRHWSPFLWIGSAAVLLQGVLTERAAAVHLEQGRDVISLEDQRAMVVAFRSQLLNGIYFALQPQITVWILTVFGTADAVAEVGALGRLAVALSLVSAVFSSLALPRFARYTDPVTVRRAYVILVTAMAGVGAIVLGAALLWPGPILAVLGPKYAHLESELVWIMAASAISLVCAASHLLNTARGWVRGVWLGVPATILAQAAIVTYVDLSTVRGAVLMQASAFAAPLAINIAIGWRAMRSSQGPPPHADVTATVNRAG